MSYDYEQKTNYSIWNESGDKTTITLEKWIADILQLKLEDVHGSIQLAYNQVCSNHPSLSRRKKGDIVRRLAENKANEYQEEKKIIFGFTDNEFSEMLKNITIG